MSKEELIQELARAEEKLHDEIRDMSWQTEDPEDKTGHDRHLRFVRHMERVNALQSDVNNLRRQIEELEDQDIN